MLRQDRATRFNYWQNGQIREGLSGWGDLFQPVEEFDLNNYLEAIRAADDLRQNGILSVITVADQGLTVWVSLRSLPA